MSDGPASERIAAFAVDDSGASCANQGIATTRSGGTGDSCEDGPVATRCAKAQVQGDDQLDAQPASRTEHPGPGLQCERTNQAWCGDITYIATDEGWLYLVGLKDLFSGEIVGFAMSERMTKRLVMQALFRAVTSHRPAKGLIQHTDRGSQGGFNRSSQHL